jgi:SSS family solute:Na+ symporter
LLSLWAGVLIGLLTVSVLIPAMRTLADEHQFHSIDEILGSIYGINVRFIGFLIVIIAAFFFACAQIHIVGEVIGSYTTLESEHAKGIVALIIVLYLAFGRYNVLIRTDIVQWALVLIALFAIVGFEGTGSFRNSVTTIPPSLGVGLGFLSALIIVGGPDTWQRAFSAASANVARKGAALAVVLYLVFTVLFLAVSATLISKGVAIDPDTSIFDAIAESEVAEFGIACLVAFIVVAAMSTADTHFFVVTTALGKFTKDYSKAQKSSPVSQGLLILLVGLGAFVVSTYVVDIVGFLFDSISAVTLFVPFLVLACLAPHRARAANRPEVAMVIGLLVYGYVFLYVDGILWNLLPVATTALWLSFSVFAPTIRRLIERT